jgi:RHS repeat-associated protein
MLFDFNHDGLSDYIVGDSTPSSTPSHPITEWRIAKNTGNGFALEKVALLQEDVFVQDPEAPSDPTLLQPEVGTSLDYDQDGFTDILLHDVYGNANNHLVLKAKADTTFALVDTNIQRPFPLQQSPKGLRNSAGAVHLADCDGDAMPDLIQCTDHGDTPETASLSTWKLHLWRPGGFTPEGDVIETLTGIPCGIEVHNIDANRDSVTDLIMPGYLRQGGTSIELSGKYSVHRRRSDGTWEVFDMGLRLPANGGRTVFGDFNGDGLPDAVQSGSADDGLYTYLNTGRGFANVEEESLGGDVWLSQKKYFHLAQPLDFDGDSKADLLVPMVDAKSPDMPRWMILRATGGTNGFTFEQIETGIPFDAVLGDIVELADPRGPRIGDINGDGAPDVAIFLDNRLHIFKNRAVDPDVLVGFSDGSNDHDSDEPGFIPNVSITYSHLIDDSKTTGQPAKDEDFYISHSDAANDCTYPRNGVFGAKRVVSGYQVNDGLGGMRRFEVRYRDGRSDRLHGWLGFGERLLIDVDTGATTATFYDNVTKVKIGEREVYPFAGQIVKQWFWAHGLPTQPNPDQIEMAFADRTLEVVPTNNGQTFFTLATKTHTRRMQGAVSGAGTITAYVGLVEALENATMLRDATVEVLDYDEYHNMLEAKASIIGVDATKHITRTVKNDVAKWMLGLPDIQTECSTGSGLQQCRTITRTTNEFGEVETESTSSSDGLDDTKLTATYERDKFGNITRRVTTDAFGHTLESTTAFDDEGVFPSKSINALGHETITEYDATLGVLKKQTDPNGISAEWGYDSLGRLETEALPDGSSTKTVTTREKIDGVWRLIERSTTTGGADDETILDSLGRPIRTYSHAPEVKANTPRVMQVFEYDRLSGNVARKSVPTAEGTPDASLKFDEYDFDAVGREIRHVTPWNAVTTTKYDGILVEVNEPLLKHTIAQVDTLGRPVTIKDAKGGLTKYKFGPFDALFTVTDPGNAVTKWTRDAFGRVRQLDEPDRGTTHYVNDGFGDVLSSMDANGRVITFGVDALGRTNTRTDTLGGQVSTTMWTWDTASNGIGKLQSVVSPDGAKVYGYNKRGQTESVKLGVSNEAFTARIAYDDIGHVKTLDYPHPLGEAPFGVLYDYDVHGFQMGVRDKATGDAYWELKDVDNAGRYKEELFGNGTKTVHGYDIDKQTLKSITTTKGASTIQQLSYDWDERLNLKSRTDALQMQNKTERFRHDVLGRLTCAYFSPIENTNAACDTSYGYAANGNLTTKSDVGSLSYTDPKHPHAVTNAPGETYTYNAVGNQITRPGGVSIDYTAFDLPRTITQGAKTVSFGYDGDQQRIRKTTSNSETLYFDNLFEQVTTGAVKEFRYYVQSPERTIAIVTHGGNEPGIKYVNVDHLGSTETITNEQGVQVEKRSYDPFGQRRNVIWGLPPPASFASKTKQGFTGHDEEDEFGLVNMKGRLFDPHLGRFLNTDPVIANLFDGQSFAAYAYVGNNPLAFVDPSGFDPEKPPILPISTKVTTEPNGTITVDLVYPPREGQPQKALPEVQTGTAGAAPTNDVGTTGDLAGEIIQEMKDAEELDQVEESITQFLAGGVLGAAEGMVPFGGLGHAVGDAFGMSDNKAPEARFGVAVGQIVGGLFATVGGLGGEVLGGAASVTGIGAAVGVPVMVVSAVVVTGGVANMAAGIQSLARLAMQNHHSDPKFMGGARRQPLTRMTKEMHDDLHNDLRNFLRDRTDAAGNHMRPQSNNSGERIQELFTTKQRRQAMADFYRQFGDKYPDAARDFFAQHPTLK